MEIRLCQDVFIPKMAVSLTQEQIDGMLTVALVSQITNDEKQK
jgi:hypothetical protein